MRRIPLPSGSDAYIGPTVLRALWPWDYPHGYTYSPMPWYGF